MTITGRAMNIFSRLLISWSDARNFGPVWYHPIIRSRAIASDKTTSKRNGHKECKRRGTQYDDMSKAAEGSGRRTYGPLTFLNISHMPSMKLWSRNHVLLSFSSSSNGMPNEFATLIVVPLSWPRRMPTTRLLEPRDIERAWWSATESSTRG